MKKIIALTAGFILLASFSFSQEKGAFGLNFRVDPQPRIGMIYHFSKQFALRPYIGFSWGSTDSKGEIQPLDDQPAFRGEREEEMSSLHFGLGFLFYFYSQRDFSAYAGINFNYGRETGDTSISRPVRRSEEEVKGNVYQTTALFGLQCRLMKNLTIFGEFGFGYIYGEQKRENRLDVTTKSRKWGLANSGIGLTFYF
jgi:hypothetical protein